MNTSLDINKLFDYYEDSKKKEMKNNLEKEELISEIDIVLDTTKSLYVDLLMTKQRIQEKDHLQHEQFLMLNSARSYINLAKKELEEATPQKKNVLIFPHKHMLGNNALEGKSKMANFMGAFGFISFNDVQRKWIILTENPGYTVLFSLLLSMLSLLFGNPSILHWVFLTMTVGTFISRYVTQKHDGKDTKINFYKNFQLFLLTYFWLFLGTQLSHIISIAALPEGGFHQLIIALLIWGELKEIVTNMKAANYKVPAIFEKIVKNHDEKDVSPPF
ncbi:hypothetical protein GNP94_21895 [Paenibacillus campinasensis]|uniref:DUF1129 family protein n=1 Tax=Paenibacillus campinasensis TaxID=66347 RepID=A0ABW9T5P9_9BACL|nr:hypothetical protein [Paenibacillus campinasensis]MUG68628.1 hypothetical protein [Paenibacillus campinasensis]